MAPPPSQALAWVEVGGVAVEGAEPVDRLVSGGRVHGEHDGEGSGRSPGQQSS